jgi:hypothetical protein
VASVSGMALRERAAGGAAPAHAAGARLFLFSGSGEMAEYGLVVTRCVCELRRGRHGGCCAGKGAARAGGHGGREAGAPAAVS